MPHFTKKHLHDKAILWAFIESDEYGNNVIDDPVEIDSKWAYGYFEIKDAKGEVVGLDAQVIVETDIDIGSILAEGELTTWLGTGSATTTVEYYEVRVVKKMPTVKGRFHRRMLLLKKYGYSLPA